MYKLEISQVTRIESVDTVKSLIFNKKSYESCITDFIYLVKGEKHLSKYLANGAVKDSAPDTRGQPGASFQFL